MNPLQLTKDGLKKLEDELIDYKKNIIPSIKKRLANARGDGDLTENNPWLTAKEDLEAAQMRVSELQNMLKTATIVEDNKANAVTLGDEIEIDLNGKVIKITLVSTMEADPTAGMISEESPLGKAIKGKKKGDKITFSSPNGENTVTILTR